MKQLKDYEFEEFYELYDNDKLHSLDYYNEIESLTPDDLKAAINCVSRYGVEANEEFIRKILHKNLTLAYEVINKGITDTCQREKLYDAICLEVGLPYPPCYGSSKEYCDNFNNLAKNINSSIGVKFHV